MIFVSKNILQLFTGSFASAIAIWPFIIVRHKKYTADKNLLMHERIHLKQQKELLILPFYLWYGIEFLIGWASRQNRMEAYKNISFEKEAYANEKNPNYLQSRTFWAFLAYLKK